MGKKTIFKRYFCVGIILSFQLAGCATLAPPEERKVQFIDNTSATKAEAYNRALAQFGKIFKNSNQSIQVRNPDDGQIVAKAVIVCNELRQFGDINDYYLHLDIDFQAKDKRIRLLFENLEMMGPNGQHLDYAVNQLTDRSKVEKVKPCLEFIRTGIVSAISGVQKENW